MRKANATLPGVGARALDAKPVLSTQTPASRQGSLNLKLHRRLPSNLLPALAAVTGDPSHKPKPTAEEDIVTDDDAAEAEPEPEIVEQRPTPPRKQRLLGGIHEVLGIPGGAAFLLAPHTPKGLPALAAACAGHLQNG